jgi:predicted nucleic acid-binding protein
LNLYLDTSALVKLYVHEEGSANVRRQVRAAQSIATSRVAYPEARAALARREREGGIGKRSLRRAVAQLDRDWSAYVVVELTESVARRAGVLAESRALRGFDAIHLASALDLSALLDAAVGFLGYDARLDAAAAAEGLETPT